MILIPGPFPSLSINASTFKNNQLSPARLLLQPDRTTKTINSSIFSSLNCRSDPKITDDEDDDATSTLSNRRLPSRMNIFESQHHQRPSASIFSSSPSMSQYRSAKTIVADDTMSMFTSVSRQLPPTAPSFSSSSPAFDHNYSFLVKCFIVFAVISCTLNTILLYYLIVLK